MSKDSKISEGRQGDHVKFKDKFIPKLLSVLSKTKWIKKDKKPIVAFFPKINQK